MALSSLYIFDQTDLRGNFSYTNTPLLAATFAEVVQNLPPVGSFLFVERESREVVIDLRDRFNSPDFLFQIDIAPEIGGVTTNANAGALMVIISNAMSHFGFRTSDIRAGWNEWRFVPYHDDDPTRHNDSDLLTQLVFNFHINRGEGTVDNDGWIGFYYMFFKDAAGRLGAFVDGWAFQSGGGEGLPDDAPDLGSVLKSVLPSFMPTIQSFLDSFCATAAFFSSPVHDSNGHPLFDQFYLLPGDGNTTFGPINTQSGYPGIFTGRSVRSVDAEVSLALLPKQKVLPTHPSFGPSNKIVTGLASVLKHEGWIVKVSEVGGVVDLKGSRVADGRNIEIDAHLSETLRKVSAAGATKRHKPKKSKSARRKSRKS